MRTLLTGGGLFDGRRHHPAGQQALLVDGARVQAVVPAAEAADLATDRSVDRVLDLAGGLVAPGFVDAHVHVVQGGLERIRCDLSGAGTREDYLRLVAAYAAEHPDGWVLGGGWEMAAFPGGTPTATDLDAVVGDRPVFLPNRDHHGAWVSSRALAMAGITADTPDPGDGRIERLPDGTPSGTLHEGAMALVTRLLPPTTPDELRRGLLAGQAYLHGLGVTGWQDAILGEYAGMDDPSATYLAAARSGELTGHVVGALWWDRARDDVEAQAAELVERRAAYTSGRLRATSVKIMQDGVAENGTAALLEPYLDRCGHASHNRGHSFVPPTVLRRALRTLQRAGFQVHVHTIGDRGVREALDAIEAARDVVPDGGPLGHAEPRHHLAHVQLVHPDDVPRFAAPRGGGQPADALGLPRRPDGRPDAAGAGSGAVGLAVPVRRLRPRRRAPGGGQRLAGHDRRPAGGDPCRGQPHGVRRRRARGLRPVPARAGVDPGAGVRGVHVRLGVGEPPRRRRRGRGRRGAAPRRRGRPGGPGP